MSDARRVNEDMRGRVQAALEALQDGDPGDAQSTARAQTREAVLEGDPSLEALGALFNSLVAHAPATRGNGADPV